MPLTCYSAFCFIKLFKKAYDNCIINILTIKRSGINDTSMHVIGNSVKVYQAYNLLYWGENASVLV